MRELSSMEEVPSAEYRLRRAWNSVLAEDFQIPPNEGLSQPSFLRVAERWFLASNQTPSSLSMDHQAGNPLPSGGSTADQFPHTSPNLARRWKRPLHTT